MNFEHPRWHSPALGRDMELLVFGHAGARALVFPTSLGHVWEWPDRRMFRWEVLGEHLERGWLQVFCVDHLPAESWYNDTVHPGAAAWRHLQYDQYLRDEVMPFTRWKNPNPYAITLGASWGAFLAASFAWRNPHLVDRVIGLSGMYDVRHQTNGYSDGNVYACNPIQFIPNEQDEVRLAALRRQDIIFATGRDDPFHWNNQLMSRLLSEKGIPNRMRSWDGWSHDWPYWEKMVRLYIAGDG